jgi:hypothetical protein
MGVSGRYFIPLGIFKGLSGSLQKNKKKGPTERGASREPCTIGCRRGRAPLPPAL